MKIKRAQGNESAAWGDVKNGQLRIESRTLKDTAGDTVMIRL